MTMHESGPVKAVTTFLTNLTAGNDQRQSPKEATTFLAHMVGTIYVLNAMHYFYSLSHETWILDSGASERMS